MADPTDSGANKFDSKKEEAHWRENHAQQPWAKNRPYEDFAGAYRTGWESLAKYAGMKYDEIEDDIALDYEKAHPDSALPWDSARPAVKAVWDRLGGVIGPRDPDRGLRSGF